MAQQFCKFIDAHGSAQRLSLIRAADAPGLTEIANELEAAKPYPGISIRRPHAEFRPFSLQLLGSRELQRPPFTDLRLRPVVRRVYKEVPDLLKPRTIKIAGADALRPYRVGDGFVVLFPDEQGETELENELEDALDVLDGFAGKKLQWQDRNIDITQAYVPSELPKLALGQMLELVEEKLSFPFDATLAPAHCPTMSRALDIPPPYN